MAVRKTIRFYDEKEDAEALRLLEHYKEYGYSCEREMIVKALLLLERRSEDNALLDASEIANKVVEQLRHSGLLVQNGENKQEEVKESESLDDALDFIDQL